MHNDEPLIFIASKYSQIVEVRGGGDQYNTGFFHGIRLKLGEDSNLTQPYKQHVWTYACIRAKATALKSVPWQIIRETTATKNNKTRGDKLKRFIRERLRMKPRELASIDEKELKRRELEVVESGSLYDTFRDVNPFMTRAQLWDATVVNLELYGSCAWVLENSTGDAIAKAEEWPATIWPFSPDQIEGDVKNGELVGWKRKSTKYWKEKKFEPWQVIWFWKYNPYEGYLHGLAPLECVKKAARQDLKAQSYNEAFFDNGADPGGVITVPQMIKDEDKRKQIVQQFDDRHAGAGKQGRTALLMGGATYDRNPSNQKDMQFIEGRKWNRDEFLSAFGVPKLMIQLYEDINMATARTVYRQFWETTVVPDGVYIEDLLDSDLFSKKPDARGYYGMFDWSTVSVLREDLKEQVDAAERLNKMGVPTADIIEHMELQLPIHSWQKKWWIPLSQVPVDEDGNKEEPTADDNKDDDQKTQPAGRSTDKELLLKLWIERVLDPVEIPYNKKLKKFWYDLRREQLTKWNDATKMARALPSEGELDQILFDKKEWGLKLANLSRGFYEMAAEFSLEQVADELGTVAWNLSDPRVEQVLMTKANKVVGVTDKFWSQLRDSVLEGMEANETAHQIGQRIREDFNEAAKPYRTQRIARTETAQVASGIRNVALRGEGVKKHQWATAMDEHVRDDHVLLGELPPVNMDHNYMSDLGKSGELYYPSDMRGPAEQVINCRCVEVPVVK